MLRRYRNIEMTKLRLSLIGILPICIAMTLGVLMLLPPRPGVTKANSDRIQKGMTLAEVERILGGEGFRGEGGDRAQFDTCSVWETDDGSIALVGFTDGGVVHLEWQESNESILDKICRWLRLR
jgi:hypothetical protein